MRCLWAWLAYYIIYELLPHFHYNLQLLLYCSCTHINHILSTVRTADAAHDAAWLGPWDWTASNQSWAGRLTCQPANCRVPPFTLGVKIPQALEAHANRYRVRPTHVCIGIGDTTV